MTTLPLSLQRQQEIILLWDKFKQDKQSELVFIAREQKQLSADLKVYVDKLQQQTFTLTEYTNRKTSDKDQVPGGYLCNFLERTTKGIYGSSKPGNATNFEVKLNSDGETYTIRKNLKKISAAQTEDSKEDADRYFQAHILPIFEAIVSDKALAEKMDHIDHAEYAAKQILRKLIAIHNPYHFVFIYSDSVIDDLYDEFVNSDATSNLRKNFEVRAFFNQLLNLDQNNELDDVLLSEFLWQYATTQALVDEDTPNVILYGPPGTGKTYAVKNSLDFLCQGDRERYEFVQFHPSFTYEDFIEGIKPKGVTKDGSIKFELVDGVFKRFCKKAKANPSKSYYFVVDEINRANLSSVFGETLLCLEKDYRHDLHDQNGGSKNLIKTQYSSLIEDMIKDDATNQSLAYHYENGSAYFGVPSNVFFIGMMNDVDKSIDAFDLALRRRFQWIRKDCDYDVIANEVKFNGKDEFHNIEQYTGACEKLNRYISDGIGLGKSYEFGHSFFMKIATIAKTRTITEKNASTLFTLHLQPTLREYLRAMFAEHELDKQIEDARLKFLNPLK
ncbi:AAA family ATPase [Vibrio vulnificus]|nr:AAA domain-containing protein [Vibrio vulnificus]HAS6174919.1 AAA domain-containing protein [Vibrio vulnificus]HAS8347349.1 restriction endonuclease [Vibrio vulnificus]HAS8509410.1 restriction endonuclease [Vibrio vulnificus]HAT8518237.1 AAA domain-containing protein [Vibrio vulnificus]